MTTKTKLHRQFTTLIASKWMQPAMLSLAIAIVLVGITGCQAPHH